MRSGARTPEELETLFEDACVVRDRGALAGLFEDGAVLVTGGSREARGSDAIVHLAAAIWDGERIYVADPRQVLQARDTALVVTPRGINVARRAGDGTWRYAIALLDIDDNTGGRKQ